MPSARNRGCLLKKIECPGKERKSLTRAKVSVIEELRAEGFKLKDLLTCANMARSTHNYVVNHPKKPTRPELQNAVKEIFDRCANGCGHRQIAMCLRAEQGVKIANKTVLKMMKELGLFCNIRTESKWHKYSSYKGTVGKTFKNIIDRDFDAKKPWQKMGTDVTEFKVAGKKAYLAPILDFCTKEIVAWNVSEHPNMTHCKLALLNFVQLLGYSSFFVGKPKI